MNYVINGSKWLHKHYNVDLDWLNWGPSITYMINYYEVPFDSHESSEETNIIVRIESCRLSILKAILFIVSSLTIIPLLIYKWFPKLRRIFLYSFCPFDEATHLSIYAQGMVIALS